MFDNLEIMIIFVRVPYGILFFSQEKYVLLGATLKWCKIHFSTKIVAGPKIMWKSLYFRLDIRISR